ncbi:hypothetical protein [Aliiglaciecola sp. LCG003]|uniref:hypothetical protein n=1 Tax=Aliiglaciecola sp. LCG003 TaxID=3053655 RepID=UPI0025748B18|nr:hypothetical protein [Aliiglaciecola sp. LCG003]WJG10094.1 hypothetical protein QR722_03380 [Aliiglaciecola sp. LCG003]
MSKLKTLTLLIAGGLLVASARSGAEQQAALPTPTKVVAGELQWNDGSAVKLFGVNYGLPFAYGYRAINKLGLDHKASIDMDVDHIDRLKLDAWRVHMWDRLLSNKQGDLLDNEHLELFDYLLMKLQQKNIKAIVTPIAWWGSGYPEPDPVEPGFAVGYSKQEMNLEPAAIAATHNYLRQLLAYKNRYTGKSVAEDPEVIAIELFNEPNHRQAAEESAAYVESLLATVRDLGVSKPLFYNISEQGNDQAFATALCNSSVDGVAYQWYPTGLVKNSALNSNMLPSVAHYTNPFAPIEACQNKAKMVYEFDAADINNSVMYPAMARSFREAGFQWATQFAYDPAELAQTNSEYNTHYLNLLYTPSKAISLMIAGEEFRQLPSDYQAADYPASNTFSNTYLNYDKDLSHFDDGSQYYYSNHTDIAPKSPQQLTQIAGVGSSPLVEYSGNGAYFLDKLQDGVWRLEVYPDVLSLQDPHQSSSLKREVSRLYLHARKLKLNLTDLGQGFVVQGINNGNDLHTQAKEGQVSVSPGVYLIGASQAVITSTDIDSLDKQYYLPHTVSPELELIHQPQRQRNVGDKLTFEVQVAGPNNHYDVQLFIRYQGHRDFTIIPMQAAGTDNYKLSLPNSNPWDQPGVLEYAFVIKDEEQQLSWPGKQSGSPADWDYVDSGFFHTLLTPAATPIRLFDPATDRAAVFNPKSAVAWPATSATEEGATLKLAYFSDNLNAAGSLLRATLANDNQLSGRNLSDYNGLAIRVRSLGKADKVQLGLIGQDGLAYGTDFPVPNEWKTLVIPLKELRPIGTLMANAYPSFMPISVGPHDSQTKLALEAITGFQLIMPALPSNRKLQHRGVEIAEMALIQY